ncbi:MAG: GTPase Era [Bdellovibrio sp.]|nr:MAG: GTPase Era [Bdellovibrio sp.]
MWESSWITDKLLRDRDGARKWLSKKPLRRHWRNLMDQYKAGFVALVGQPNAGKSSFVNHFVGERVGIVTPKPQTTRKSVQGIYTSSKGQIIFIDAPGRVKPSSTGLNGFLEKELESAIKEADVLLAILNLDAPSVKEVGQIISLCEQAKKSWIPVISKVDLKKYRHRIDIIKNLLPKRPFLFSVKKSLDKECEGLLQQIFKCLPPSPGPLYGEEIFTTQNLRDWSAEIIRETCFECLKQEIPYLLDVRIQRFAEHDRKKPYVLAEVVLGKEKHKPIVIGSEAKKIKEIGLKARQKIERCLGKSIYLELHVKVQKNWFKNPFWLKELGYV